jgi:PPM family protein phosphatase
MDETTRRMQPPVSGLGVSAFGVSECGPVRQGNEDAFAIDLDIGLFVVADGMGGHAAGEIASRLAVETIVAFVTRSLEDADLTWPSEFDPSLSADGNRLRTALHLANRRVWRAAASDLEYDGMGTTAVAVVVNATSVVVAHAGDSRVYEHRAGRLTRLTDDDSVLASAASEDPPGPARFVLTNALGGDADLDVHVREHPRTPGLRLLLCTDGVHGPLGDAAIGDILARPDGPQPLAERLVAAALAAGGRDNATALVVTLDVEAE